MPIELNALESDRFGIVAARLTDPAAPLDVVDAAAKAADVDLITTRVDAGDLPRIHALEAAGFRLMDTLVYYQRALGDDVVVPDAGPDISLRLASADDSPAVSAIAQAAFQGYFGHYHADPRLEDAAADAAYVQWAEKSVAAASSEAPVIVACDPGGPVGFLTLRQNSLEEFELVLSGIDAESQKKGLYTTLIAEGVLLSRKAGARRVITSTQVNNYGVQRVWSRMGFSHYRSLYTLHKWYAA